MKNQKYLECHQYDPNVEMFEGCNVTYLTSDALSEHCVGCPYNKYSVEATRQFLKVSNGRHKCK